MTWPEKTQKEMDDMRDWLRIAVTQRMLEYGLGDMIIHECPQCRTKYPFVINAPDSVESIVDLIMEMGEQSETFRLTMLAYVADEIQLRSAI